MRCCLCSIAAAALLGLALSVALSGTPRAEATPSRNTRIEVDEGRKIVSIIVDGRTVVRIDRKSMVVYGPVKTEHPARKKEQDGTAEPHRSGATDEGAQ